MNLSFSQLLILIFLTILLFGDTSAILKNINKFIDTINIYLKKNKKKGN